MKSNDKRLGTILTQLREKKGLTMEELSKLSGVARGTIGDIEVHHNKSTVKTLEKLSEAMELSQKDRAKLFLAFIPEDIMQDKSDDIALDPLVEKINKLPKEQKTIVEAMIDGLLAMNQQTHSK